MEEPNEFLFVEVISQEFSPLFGAFLSWLIYLYLQNSTDGMAASLQTLDRYSSIMITNKIHPRYRTKAICLSEKERNNLLGQVSEGYCFNVWRNAMPSTMSTVPVAFSSEVTAFLSRIWPNFAFVVLQSLSGDAKDNGT